MKPYHSAVLQNVECGRDLAIYDRGGTVLYPCRNQMSIRTIRDATEEGPLGSNG